MKDGKFRPSRNSILIYCELRDLPTYLWVGPLFEFGLSALVRGVTPLTRAEMPLTPISGVREIFPNDSPVSHSGP